MDNRELPKIISGYSELLHQLYVVCKLVFLGLRYQSLKLSGSGRLFSVERNPLPPTDQFSLHG